jgi:hypothetical protein
MLGQTLELRVGTGRGEDLGVADGCHPSPLPLESARHDSRTTALSPASDDLVDKLHQLVIQPNRDLLAHTKMVPVWVVGRLRTHDELRFERVTAGLGSPPVRFATGRKPDLQALRETGATGLEPATSGVTGRRSNQLNYAPGTGGSVAAAGIERRFAKMPA